MSVDAPVLPCRGCGAPLAVDPSAAAATCPRCRAVTPVPDALRRQAAVYASALGAERRKVEFARSFGKTSFDKMGKYFGPPFGALVAVYVVAQIALDEDSKIYATLGFVGGMALLGVAFFAWIAIASKREVAEAASPAPVAAAIFEGSVTGTCSTCGGRVPFGVEQSSARCPYCSATVFPTQTDQTALLAMAGERADLESARASRTIVRELARAFDGGAVTSVLGWVRWLPFLMAPVMLVGVGGMLAFGNGVPDVTSLDGVTLVGVALMGGGVLVFAVVCGVALLLRRGARGGAVAMLAQAFGGSVKSGVGPLLDWLDAYWAAAVPQEVLDIANSDQGARIVRTSVAFQFMGRPAMVVVANAPHVRRTDLFFSSYRRRSPEQGAATRAAQEVQGAGFSPLVSNAGVHLARPDSDPRAIAPESVKWLLERAGRVSQA